MALLIKTDGTTKEIYPKNAKDGFMLDELYSLIGCRHIEIAQTNKPGYIMVIDEEGKLADEPELNMFATILYRYREHDVIVGNAVFCRDDEVK